MGDAVPVTYECCIQSRSGPLCDTCHPMYWYDWLLVGILGLMALYVLYSFAVMILEATRPR